MKFQLEWFWNISKGYRLKIVMPFLLNIIAVCASLLFVEYTQKLLSCYNSTLDVMYTFIMILIVIKIIQLIAEQLEVIIREKTCSAFELRLTKLFFRNLYSIRVSQHQKLHSGDALSRLTADVSSMANTVTNSVPLFVFSIIQFIATSLYLSWINPYLTFFIILIMPIAVVVGKNYNKLLIPLSFDIRVKDSKISQFMLEHLQQYEVLNALGQKNVVKNTLGSLCDNLFSIIKKRINVEVAVDTLIESGFSAGYLVVLIWGVWGMRENSFSYAQLIAFIQLIGQIQRPVIMIKSQYPLIINGVASICRLKEIEELPKEEENIMHLEGCLGIKLDNLCYRYSADKPYIYYNFTYNIIPSSFTVIMGETGIGKSTLFRLILSFAIPNSGKVFLYNDKTQIEANETLRNNIAYVPQGNSIISGTIKYNLLLGNQNATDENLKHALHVACADFVTTLPNGIETEIGEGGFGLSEGEAHRISIARALLKDAPILLLDEPTAAVDDSTEESMMKRIKESLVGKTIIIITHNINVCKYATNILNL